MDIKDAIIERTVGNLYWKDKDGKYMGCNSVFANLIGLQSPKDIVGKTDEELFLKNLGKKHLQALIGLDQEVIKAGQERVVEEIGIDEQGKIAYYMTHKSPLKDEQGNVIGLVGNSINITKQKAAEIAKTDFLTSMAHDIRTPFCGVYSIIELLFNKVDDAEQKEWLGQALTAAKSLLRLLNQILDVAKMGGQEIRITSFNIRHLIDDIADLLKAEVKMKNLKIEIECPNVFVNTDEFRIRCIILNLVGNAVKFTQKGKINIRVRVSTSLEVEIEDTGCGIPEDKLDYIFDKFTKLLPSNKSQEFFGSGLGLFMSKTIAKELGGDISVRSELGKGSTFILSCPSSL